MKAISKAAALCGFAITTLIFSAAHDDALRPELEQIELTKSADWVTCFEQYTWPQGQNVLFDPNCRESHAKRAWTPLHVAMHHGYGSIAQLLLENGALVLQDATGKFPYEVELNPHAAHRYQEYTDAQALVKETRYNGHLILTSADGYFAKVWPGHDFAGNPNVRDTLPAGIHNNAFHGHRLTPLHAAVAYGDVAFTKELLKRGALFLRNRRGNFPHKVECAYSVPRPENKQTKALARVVFRTLSPMHIAALDYNTEMIEALAKIDHSYVHAEDQFGRTPLIYLVQSHPYRDQEKHDDEALFEVIRTLMQYGSKVGREDRFGKSAYTYYAESESTSDAREAILELLK